MVNGRSRGRRRRAPRAQVVDVIEPRGAIPTAPETRARTMGSSGGFSLNVRGRRRGVI